MTTGKAPAKVCAVPFRITPAGTEILVFRHPLAGVQLVKGTLEAGETTAEGARRELAEESGLIAGDGGHDLGACAIGDASVSWHFRAFAMPEAPDSWRFHTADDAGHAFDFFWHPLDQLPDDSWHSQFHQALDFIRERLRPIATRKAAPGSVGQ